MPHVNGTFTFEFVFVLFVEIPYFLVGHRDIRRHLVLQTGEVKYHLPLFKESLFVLLYVLVSLGLQKFFKILLIYVVLLEYLIQVFVHEILHLIVCDNYTNLLRILTYEYAVYQFIQYGSPVGSQKVVSFPRRYHGHVHSLVYLSQLSQGVGNLGFEVELFRRYDHPVNYGCDSRECGWLSRGCGSRIHTNLCKDRAGQDQDYV